jgi:hypothetical protein
MNNKNIHTANDFENIMGMKNKNIYNYKDF